MIVMKIVAVGEVFMRFPRGFPATAAPGGRTRGARSAQKGGRPAGG